MISKDTYKGKACSIAVHSAVVAVDDGGRWAKGQSLLRQAKRGGSYALSVGSLSSGDASYEGVYLLNDGAGVDLSFQVRSCPWFHEVSKMPAASEGFMVVFPLDTKIYVAVVGDDGDISQDMVITNMAYAEMAKNYIKKFPEGVIYRVASEGKASKAAHSIDLGSVGHGYFDNEGRSGLDVFDKQYRLSRLSLLMPKQGYFHPVVLNILVALALGLVGYGFYVEREAEINEALRLAAAKTKEEQQQLFSDHVGFDGSHILSAYSSVYSDLVRENIRRDALRELNLTNAGNTLTAAGVMSVSGSSGVPAQTAYPENAYQYAERTDGVSFWSGVSGDGWKLTFAREPKIDKRELVGWSERDTKRRLMDIARVSFSELTLIDESQLASSPSIYELTFSLKITNSNPSRLNLIADYFVDMPVSLDGVTCDFGQIDKAVGCLIVGQAAYLY